MSVPPRVLSRLESSPKNRIYSDSIKIIRRYDASSGDLRAVANAERRPHNEQSSLVEVDFLGLLNAAKAFQRLAAGVGGRQAFAQVEFDRHLQMRTQFVVQVVLETTAAEECGEPLDNAAQGRAHKLGSP